MNFGFYPEVFLTWKDGFLTCSAPWLVLSFDFPFAVTDPKLRTTFVSLLAQHALRYPFVYANAKSSLRRGDKLFSLDCLIDEISDELRPFNREFPGPQWDLGAIAKKSHTSVGLNPVAIFTHIRRNIFIEATRRQNTRLVDGLNRSSNDHIRTTLVHILNQSYYVTVNCIPSLSAGIAKAGGTSFGSALERYMGQEDGHHNLIHKSLTALGYSPDITKVHWSVRAAISVLAWCAHHSQFALASCIGLFEMASYANTDPVAELADRIGNPKAAKPLWAHFEINKREEHACIGLDLSFHLDYLTARDLASAGYCAELLCHLFSITEAHYLKVVESQ